MPIAHLPRHYQEEGQGLGGPAALPRRQDGDGVRQPGGSLEEVCEVLVLAVGRGWQLYDSEVGAAVAGHQPQPRGRLGQEEGAQGAGGQGQGGRGAHRSCSRFLSRLAGELSSWTLRAEGGH